MVGSGNGNYIVRDDILCVNLDGTIIRYPPLKEGSYCDIRGVKRIAKGAFRGCINLEEIAVNSSSEPMIIEEGAFYECSNLKTVTGFESTNPTLNLTFYGCEKLTSIELPTTVEEIGYETFKGCTSLTGDLVIPDNVKAIGANAYEGCTGFKGKLIIPNSVETIGDRAFKGCTGVLEGGELYLGTGLKQIGGGTFDAGSDDNASIPSSFSKIYCNATIPPIIDYNYSELGCEQLIVPKGYLEVYQNSNWASVSNYITEEN